MNIVIPEKLSGNFVELHPLTRAHFSELTALANDKRIWQHYPFDGTDDSRFSQTLEQALVEKEKGTQIPFAIFHKQSKKLIGSTRFMEIVQVHKKLEIGFTWLHPEVWGTVINPECKLLLLTHAFEKMLVYRVQLRTDENNIRSRTAILKIGATFEGIFRNDMVRDNGTRRNSAYFSIIESEWQQAKEKLIALIDAAPGTKI